MGILLLIRTKLQVTSHLSTYMFIQFEIFFAIHSIIHTADSLLYYYISRFFPYMATPIYSETQIFDLLYLI